MGSTSSTRSTMRDDSDWFVENSKNHKVMRFFQLSKYRSLFLVLLALPFLLLGSAKWTLFFGPWIGCTLLLFYSRQVKIRQILLPISLTYFLSTLIGGFNVIPFPLPVVVIVSLVVGLKSTIPYVLDKWLYQRFPSTYLMMTWRILLRLDQNQQYSGLQFLFEFVLSPAFDTY